MHVIPNVVDGAIRYVAAENSACDSERSFICKAQRLLWQRKGEIYPCSIIVTLSFLHICGFNDAIDTP